MSFTQVNDAVSVNFSLNNSASENLLGKKKDVSSVFSEFIVICWQLDNEEPADDDSDFDEYDSVFLPV